MAAADHRVPITKVVDIYVSAGKCDFMALSRNKKQMRRGQRQASCRCKDWAAYAPCRCLDSPMGHSKAQRPCTIRRLLNIKTSPCNQGWCEKK